MLLWQQELPRYYWWKTQQQKERTVGRQSWSSRRQATKRQEEVQLQAQKIQREGAFIFPFHT